MTAMIQILMSQEAFERVRHELEKDKTSLTIVTLDADGSLTIDGKPVEAGNVDPEVFWLSRDTFFTPGMLQRIFEIALRGSKGRWLHTTSAGLDNYSFKEVIAKGIQITKNIAQAPPIAEYVLAHAISLLHPIDQQRALQDARQWEKTPYREIADTRWVIVGFGAIGQEIAKRAKAFGVHITAIRRNMGSHDLADTVAGQKDLPSILPDADVVVLACPLNQDTHGVAGKTFFEAMKTDAILINIGRGALINDSDLRRALDDNRLRRAVLDVFSTEPLPPDAWFWSHPKVRVSAHTSYNGSGMLRRSEEIFLENLRRYKAGLALPNLADKSEVGL